MVDFVVRRVEADLEPLELCVDHEEVVYLPLPARGWGLVGPPAVHAAHGGVGQAGDLVEHVDRDPMGGRWWRRRRGVTGHVGLPVP